MKFLRNSVLLFLCTQPITAADQNSDEVAPLAVSDTVSDSLQQEAIQTEDLHVRTTKKTRKKTKKKKKKVIRVERATAPPTVTPTVKPTPLPTPTPTTAVARRGLQPDCRVATPDRFNMCLDLESLNGRDASWMQAFTQAKARWESVIVGSDNEPFSVSNVSSDYIATTRPDFLISDIYIAGVEASIDGLSGVLGSAGPKYARIVNGKLKTTAGFMMFDSADIDSLIRRGTWENVILHEMGHVFGIGTLWSRNNLHSGSTSDPIYTGAHALEQWQDVLGCSGGIPVETDGGSGTAGGHFDEDCLDSELMTGIAESSQDMKLSRMTVGTLQDLGYEVDYNAADEYTQDDLAFCNFSSRSYCPEHRNRAPLGRRLRASSHRRQLSAQGTELAVLEGAKMLKKEREEADKRETDDDLIFIGGDVVTVFIEEGGQVFGKTVTWDQVKDRTPDINMN